MPKKHGTSARLRLRVRVQQEMAGLTPPRPRSDIRPGSARPGSSLHRDRKRRRQGQDVPHRELKAQTLREARYITASASSLARCAIWRSFTNSTPINSPRPAYIADQRMPGHANHVAPQAFARPSYGRVRPARALRYSESWPAPRRRRPDFFHACNARAHDRPPRPAPAVRSSPPVASHPRQVLYRSPECQA